ncbi:MAG: extracellular solute-binding protein [Acidimicrobiia bacterium]
MTLRVALVAGPMYDHLYSVFDAADIDADIAVHEDHPTLNRRVAEILNAGERLDLISTHAKYAPSQSAWLRPLDDLIDPAALAALAPSAVDLGRFAGRLWCVPRNIDVRVLWVRTDRVASPPNTWTDLDASETVFGFPGRESGLFGTFFELVAGSGGELFDTDHRPAMNTPEAVRAIERLVRLSDRAPADLPTWHYDDVDRALLDGRVDATAAWPGAWGAISRSELADRLTPHLYPAGTEHRVSYSGCHAWAIPKTAQDTDGATALLHLLIGEDAQALDASGGTICAHEAAFAAVVPVNDTDRARLEITRQTIAEAMITYPPLAAFPAIEDAGWSAIHDALEHRISPAEAAARIQSAAETVLTNPKP